MAKQVQKSFEFAQDLTKQLITLATSIIAVEITFSKDLIQKLPDCARYCAITSWAAFMLSILFGIFTLMALTGNLTRLEKGLPATIMSKNVTRPSKIQIFFFLLGLAFTICYGFEGFKAIGKVIKPI